MTALVLHTAKVAWRGSSALTATQARTSGTTWTIFAQPYAQEKTMADALGPSARAYGSQGRTARKVLVRILPVPDRVSACDSKVIMTGEAVAREQEASEIEASFARSRQVSR